MRKPVLAGLLTLLLTLAMVGCDLFGTTTVTTSSTTATTTTTTISTTTVSEDPTDLDVRLQSIYQLAVTSGSFTGTYEEWLETVRGPAGREIALQVSGGYVQWKYSTDTLWNNLVALSTLVGPAGSNGQTPTFRVSGTKLQWQYSGAATWTDLFDLSLLTGDAGKEIDLRVENGFLQWQKDGDPAWTNLIDLSTLVAQPTIAISVDGFWVINGVKTEYPAVAQILVQTVTVTFDLDGGTLPEGTPLTTTVPKGDAMDLPVPVKEGYEFKGWITGTGLFDVSYNNYTPFVKDTTLHALWEKNLDQILAFLNAPSGMNFSGTKTLLVTATIDGANVVFDQTGTMKMAQQNGWTSRFSFDQERDLIDGAWVVRHESQGYELVHSVLTNETAEAFQLHLSEGAWRLMQEPSEVRLETGFELFDPERFVKRPGENKYDYPITDDQLRLYGVPVGTDVTLSRVECVFDADLGEIVIAMEGLAKMDTAEFHPVSAVLTLRLYDVGTTVVTVPLPLAKDAVTREILEVAEHRRQTPEYMAAYEPSRQPFENMVDDYLRQVVLAAQIGALATLQNEAKAAIFGYSFEYDDLAFRKAEAARNLSEHVAWLCQIATADSCAAIMAHHASAVQYVFDASDEALLQERLNLLYGEFQALFVEEPAKAELLKHRERTLELLDVYQEILDPYLTDDMLKGRFEQRWNEARNAIQNAPSVAAIEDAYEAFYQAILSENVAWGDVGPARTFLLAQLMPYGETIDLLFQEGYDLDVQIGEYFEFQYAALAQMTELLPLIHQTIVVYQTLEASVLPVASLRARNMASDIRNATLPGLDATASALLEEAYRMTLDRIRGAKGLWEIDAALADFRQIADNLPQSTWMLAVNVATGELLALANQRAAQAEPESAQVMLDLANLAKAALQRIPENDQATLDFQTAVWKRAIEWADVPLRLDQGMAALAALKAEKSAFVDDLYVRIVQALAEGESLASLNAWRNQYLTAIAQANSTAEVNTAMANLVSTWTALNLHYKTDLETIRTDFLESFDAMHQAGLAFVPSYPETVESQYQTVRTNLATQSDPILLIMSGVSALHLFPLTYQNVVRAFTAEQIELRHAWFMETCPESIGTICEQIRDLAILRLEYFASMAEMLPVLIGYEETMRLLPQDPFKAQLRQTIEEWTNRFNQLYLTASDEARQTMLAERDLILNSLRASQTQEELAIALRTAFDMLESHYVADADRWELEHYRAIYRAVGMEIVEGIQFHAGNEELDHLLMASYWQVVERWNQDVNSTDMHLHYEEWLAFVDGLQYDYDAPLNDLIALLEGELDLEYASLLLYGVAGDAELESVMSTMRTMLQSSASPVWAIANRVMGEYGAAEWTARILFDRAVAELDLVYAQYQAVVSAASLPALAELRDRTEQALRLEFDLFDHASLLLKFHQEASQLP